MSDTAQLSHSLISNSEAKHILYLHGFMGGRGDWRETIDALGNRFSHLTIDLPGHHMPADKLAATQYTMPGCAQLVVDLLDRLQVHETHLVAYSMEVDSDCTC